jgi:signal transduction histidine kinase
VVLVIAVVLPTAGVLWFMNEAMQNERLAVRQRLTELYRSQLQSAAVRVQGFWQDTVLQLSQTRQQKDPPAAFAGLVQRGTVDSILIYDDGACLAYPDQTTAPQSSPEVETGGWQEARRLEYERNAPSAAARLYMEIARRAPDPTDAARALLAQARCLNKAGQSRAAIVILTGALNSGRYTEAVDPQGRLILPNALFLALNLIKDHLHPLYGQTAMTLAGRLNDYKPPFMPSSQRRFLMRELRSSWPACPPFPTLDAEDLAAAYLETHLAELTPGRLQLTALAETWGFQTPDRGMVALFRQEGLLAKLQAAVEALPLVQGVSFTLLPPGKANPGPAPLLSSSLGDTFPMWQVSLSLEGPDPFDSASSQRNAVYLWTGVLVTIAIGMTSLLLAGYLERQIRLTRLKNDLIATVSHELKTPLASMRLLVDTLLAGRCQDAAQLLDYLQLIAKENSRLSSLIDVFLTFSRMERNKTAFERTPLRTDEIVGAALDAIGERLRAPGCQLEVSLAQELPSITGDREALATVLVNLLDNALKYSGEEKQIQLRGFAANGFVCIEVADNGVGFPRGAAKRIFDRFYQVDQSLSRRAGGCGLGLSIVKFIVTAHGGEVTARSQVGKGSTFTVRLPAA